MPRQEGIEPEVRDLPAVHDGRTYVDIRLTTQIEPYYVPRARRIVRTLRRLHVVEVALGLFGTALGVVAAASTISLAAWIKVVATVGTALATHIAAARYEFQRVEFEHTAYRLRQLREDSDAPGITHAELAAIVAQAGDVISVENRGWMAKLAEQPPGPGRRQGGHGSGIRLTDGGVRTMSPDRCDQCLFGWLSVGHRQPIISWYAEHRGSAGGAG